MQAIPQERTNGQIDPDDPRLRAFAAAIDALRSEVEADIGEKDQAHIRRIVALSRTLEVIGRSLIYVSIEPVAFGLGVGALWAHKSLELMEIGHMALHGAYDRLPNDKLHSNRFQWKAPIDEVSWRSGHNIRNRQSPNAAARAPQRDAGAMQFGKRVPFGPAQSTQPMLSWFGFALGVNMQVTGLIDDYLKRGSDSKREPGKKRAARRAFWTKTVRYYGKEFGLYPMLAGPLGAGKVAFGNLLSEMGRDLYAAATFYCGHVGADDYPAQNLPTGRARWYKMQVEGTRNIDVPRVMSILSGACDRRIEHHLFPRLPPNRLREISPRVRALCEQHGVKYQSESWPRMVGSVLGTLRKLGASKPKTT